jgi:UDP-GlcNAc:undecaprenyl-phosphate GlcNAc-1-phosphate transferase
MKGPATVVLAVPTALLTIPFFDTAAAITRRKLTGRSIFATDRGHLHHCLLRQGASPRRVLFWVGLACLLTSAGALASLTFQHEAFALLAAFTPLPCWPPSPWSASPWSRGCSAIRSSCCSIAA